MSSEITSQGSLFSSDFLTESIQDMADWSAVTDGAVDRLKATLENTFTAFRIDQNRTEADTETELIWPVLAALGWTAFLTQQNLSPRGRDDIPDGLLFENEETKAHATGFPEQWKRYELGLVVVESKRWARPLDRRSGRSGEETAPSSQMLRYLRRIDDVTQGNLRWGILTNGAKWRLYFSGARSVSEQFFELDLAAILDLPGHNEGLFALSEEDRLHWLKVFMLVFRREAFVPTGADPRSFHEKALEEGKFYEERVAEDLSNKVFKEVFPELVRAIIAAAPEANFQEVREGALIILYRLLFILYAEDRDLLPVKNTRYDDYGLREKVRLDVGARKDRDDVFSDTASRYWGAMNDLFLAIDQGDNSIGLPPYNGGLFDQDRNPILTNIRIPDAVMARVIDALSFERTDEGRKYINYRNLSVQQLGSIYERLLEYEVADQDGEIIVQPNIFARKGSGSYYTPDDLVQLILTETLDPLVAARKAAFKDKIAELAKVDLADDRKIGNLKRIDSAEKILELKICDPAMGSGHFLVSLVDYLADQVITAMSEVEFDVPKEWGDYISPLGERIDTIRNTILANAEERKWTIDEEQLDDRHIIRRMVLKRCIYGVDKNPMAVELAKVSLWLHTFTVGAPLSFLDHHLRCGDSLFGSWVRAGVDKAHAYGSPLLLNKPITRALRAASKMQIVEGLTDAEIAEAHRSADVFAEVEDMTAPLNALLSLIHALDWLEIKDKAQKIAIVSFFDGELGDPIDIAMGKMTLKRPKARAEGARMKGRMTAEEKFDLFAEIYSQAKALIDEENFMNWQVTFPGIWSDWEAEELSGGFDAVIGNPPWDKMRFEEIPWFERRVEEIALLGSGDERKQAIEALRETDAELFGRFEVARARSVAATRMARSTGDYPLLSGGDTNIYSLFVERSRQLINDSGVSGLLVPSGIASDRTSAQFFEEVSTGAQLRSLIDFENRRPRYGLRPFFEDVDSRFKFCVFVMGADGDNQPARCAFFLQAVDELNDDDVVFEYSADDFARVNPNTKTAPIFRSKRQADLCAEIYTSSPVYTHLENDVRQYPIRLGVPMHITHDSRYFKKRSQLEDEGFYHVGDHVLEKGDLRARPLYEGKMMMDFDHRSSDVVVNLQNLKRPAQPKEILSEEKLDPNRLSVPRFWVKDTAPKFIPDLDWLLVYKNVCSPTNRKGMIACMVPTNRCGHSLQILVPDEGDGQLQNYKNLAPLLLANISAISFDFVARSKIQGQNLSWYIFEQLPVVPIERLGTEFFGSKSAETIIREAVLELTYTAHDMASFARDMGYVDAASEVKPPFTWNEERRLVLRAKLDAVFFHLYGITDRDDIRYIYSTFPIIEREEKAAYEGVYRSCELCLAYMNALAAGNPDAEIRL